MTADAGPPPVLGAVDDGGWISGPSGGDEPDGWICEVGREADDCWATGAPLFPGLKCASAAVCAQMVAQGRELAAAADDDDETCYHEHDEECYDYDDRLTWCSHEHCFACGGCRCAGYCDDYQTYNLRPGETGAGVDEQEG